MNNRCATAFAAAGFVTATALAGCSSNTTSESSADIASLDARVSVLESQVAGLESIIGQTIILDGGVSLLGTVAPPPA